MTLIFFKIFPSGKQQNAYIKNFPCLGIAVDGRVAYKNLVGVLQETEKRTHHVAVAAFANMD